MQDKKKKTKKQIKVQDLKPSKDAKGGFIVAGHQAQGRGVQGRGVQRPGNPNT
jgi:hypothetical protein